MVPQVSCLVAEHLSAPTGSAVWFLHCVINIFHLQHYPTCGRHFKSMHNSAAHQVDPQNPAFIHKSCLTQYYYSKCNVLIFWLLPYLFGRIWHSDVSKNILFPPIYLFAYLLSIWNNEFHPLTSAQIAS